MSTETNFSTTDTTTYGLPLEERYRLQLEACMDYYCTQLGYKFEIDKRNVEIQEMNAQIEAKKASLQILSCITIET